MSSHFLSSTSSPLFFLLTHLYLCLPEEVPYEVVVKELERDTVGSSASLGFRGRRFKCGHFPSAVFVTIKVREEMECEGKG